MWALYFRVSHKLLQSGCQLSCSHLKALLGEDLLPSSHGCWQDSVSWGLFDRGPQFHAGFWPMTSLSPVPWGPLQYDRLFHLKHMSCEGNRESLLTGQKVTIFHNLVTEVTAQHIYHILLTRSQSLDQALHWKGEEITQNHEHQEAGIIGGHLEIYQSSNSWSTDYVQVL